MVGFTTSSLFNFSENQTLAPATGPSKGIPAIIIAKDPPNIANVAISCTRSKLSGVIVITISFTSHFGNIGRSVRSTIRQPSTAISVGLHSLLRYAPPPILPAA